MHKDPVLTLEKTKISPGSSLLAGLFEDGLKLSGALKTAQSRPHEAPASGKLAFLWIRLRTKALWGASPLPAWLARTAS